MLSFLSWVMLSCFLFCWALIFTSPELSFTVISYIEFSSVELSPAELSLADLCWTGLSSAELATWTWKICMDNSQEFDCTFTTITFYTKYVILGLCPICAPPLTCRFQNWQKWHNWPERITTKLLHGQD